MMAYDNGLKGVTYMRDGSREGVLSRVDEKPAEQPIAAPVVLQAPIVARPAMVAGFTYRTETPVGTTYITINHNENNEPYEMFINIGKSGSDVSAMAEALGRMISLNLRIYGALAPRERMRQVVSELTGIGGARSMGFGENRVRSLPDAVAKVLAKHYAFKVNGVVEDKSVLTNGHAAAGAANGLSNGHSNVDKIVETMKSQEQVVLLAQLPIQEQVPVSQMPVEVNHKNETHLFDICPSCGAGALAYEEGCRKCYACGHSEC